MESHWISQGGDKMKKILSLVTFLIVLGLLIGCQQIEDDFFYVNDKYGFTFEIPSNWEGKYEVIEAVDGLIDFKYTGYEDEGGGHQEFFFIGVTTKEEYEKASNDLSMTGVWLAERDDQVYILNMPLDNIILDKEKVEEYIQISLSVDEVKERFSLHD